MAAVDVLGMLPQRTNYSKDPQATRTAWWLPTGGTVATDASRYFSGTGSILFTATGAIAANAAIVTTPLFGGVAPNDPIPVTAGDNVSAMQRVSTDLVGKQVYLRMRFYTAAGVEVTTGGPWQTSPFTLVAGADKWNVLDLHDVTVPAIATLMTVGVYATSTFASTDKLYFDGQDVAKNQDLRVFVSGDLGPLYAWNGTANQSTSYRKAEAPVGITGQGGVTTVETRVYSSDMKGNLYAELTDYVVGGEIAHDTDRDFMGTVSLDITDPSLFPAFSWVKVYQIIESETGSDEDGTFSVGLFRLSQPAATWIEGTGKVEGYDATIQLNDTTLTTTLNLAAGQKYVTAIANLLTTAGFVGRFVIPDYAAVIPTGGLTFFRGTSYLEIVNDLLGDIGYYRLYMMPDGTLTSQPFIDRLRTEPTHSWHIGQDAEIVGSVDEQVNDDDLYNYVVVSKTDSNKVTTIRTAENKNPAHPYSTVALGLLADPTGATKTYRTKRVEFNDAVSATELAAKAREVLELSSMLRYVTVMTLPHPRHVPHEIAELLFDGTTAEHLTGRFYIESSSFGLVGSDALMTMKMRRIESYE